MWCEQAYWITTITAVDKKKTTEEQVFRPLSSFHNGIILIVNCLKSFAKIHNLFYIHKYYLQVVGIELAARPMFGAGYDETDC